MSLRFPHGDNYYPFNSWNVCSAGSADGTRKDYWNLQKKECGCLSSSIVIESCHVFCEILADLFQLEEFYFAVDKELALFESTLIAFWYLWHLQLKNWRKLSPLSGKGLSQCNTICRNLSFITSVVSALWTLYSRGGSLAVCTSTDATAIWSSCIANHISHDISTPPTHSKNK